MECDSFADRARARFPCVEAISVLDRLPHTLGIEMATIRFDKEDTYQIQREHTGEDRMQGAGVLPAATFWLW